MNCQSWYPSTVWLGGIYKIIVSINKIQQHALQQLNALQWNYVERPKKRTSRGTRRPVSVLSKYKSNSFYVPFTTTGVSRIISTSEYRASSLITHNDCVHGHGIIWNETKYRQGRKKASIYLWQKCANWSHVFSN